MVGEVVDSEKVKAGSRALTVKHRRTPKTNAAQERLTDAEAVEIQQVEVFCKTTCINGKLHATLSVACAMAAKLNGH